MKKFALFLIMSLLAASCSNPSAPPTAEAQPPSSAASPPTASQSEPASPAETLPNEPPVTADSGRSASDNGENPEQPEKIEKTHRMNENYIIVPKTEDGNKKVVLLTFDDGPKKAEWVDAMLEVLDKHEAKAIFFVNGYRVEQNPDLLIKIAEKEQIIGNHSWDHVNLKELTHEEIDRQIEDVQKRVEQLTGEAPHFFRPPHGASNDYVKEKAARENMLFMTWSNGSEDWLETNQNPEKVIARVMEQLHSGSNILMHELPWTIEALDTLLTKLKNEGYDFIDPRAIEIPAQEE